MKSIVDEKQKVFVHVCALSRFITQAILENYNDELTGKEISEYTNIGNEKSPSKLYIGKLLIPRILSDQGGGRKACIYLLLAQTVQMEKIALTVTAVFYCASASVIDETFGQTISHGGIWNLI